MFNDMNLLLSEIESLASRVRTLEEELADIHEHLGWD